MFLYPRLIDPNKQTKPLFIGKAQGQARNFKFAFALAAPSIPIILRLL